MKNPVLSRAIEFDGIYKISMSVQGAVNKTGFLTLLLLFAAGWAWQNVNNVSSPLIWAALIGGLVTALLIIFSPVKAPWLSPIYAILEGVVLGGVSASFRGEGIVQNAVLSTLGVLVCMLVLYKLRIIKVTQQFVAGVLIATGGICFVYIMDLVLIMFGVRLPYLHQGGWLGILISLVVVGVAALNLILDFNNIEEFTKNHAPKYMEWYCAFGVLLTLVWLYLELLNLFRKLKN